MAKRIFNWKLALVLIIALVVIAVSAITLRKVSRSRTAKGGLINGKQAYQQQQWSQAAKELGRYISVNRDNTEILMMYAESLLNIRPLKRDQILQAVESYRTVLRLEPGNEKAAEKLAELYLRISQPGEAEMILDRHPAVDQNKKLSYLLALSMAQQRRFKDAAQHLEKLIEKFPDYTELYQLRGQITAQRPEDFNEDPLKWFDKAVQNSPENTSAYVARADYLGSIGKTELAKEDLQKANQLGTEDTDVLIDLARAMARADMLDTAKKQLEKVQQQDPQNIELWRTKAAIALQFGDSNQAETTADAALKNLQENSSDFLTLASELYLNAQSVEKAAQCIDRMENAEVPAQAIAFYKGLLAQIKGNLQQAIINWQKSLELGNNSPRLRILLASTLAETGDINGGIQQLRMLVGDNPNNFRARLNLANLLYRAGDFDAAEEHAAIAAQLNPDDKDAALLYARVRSRALGADRTSTVNAEWAGLLEQLEKLRKQNPDSLDINIAYAQYWIQKGNFEKARELTDKIIAENPDNVDAALLPVEILSAQGKTEQAITALNTVKDKFPNASRPVRYLVAAYMDADNRQKAVEVVKSSLQKADNSVDKMQLAMLLADLAAGTPYAEQVIPEIEKLLEQMPDSLALIRRMLNFDTVLQNSEKAQKLIDRAKKLEGPDGWQWRYEQARLWYASEDFKQYYRNIVELLKEAILTNPAEPDLRALLASTYAKNNQLRLAISTYKEALSLSPSDSRIITGLVSALYQAREFEQADTLLKQAKQRNIQHPMLSQIQLQSYLRQGKVSDVAQMLEETVSAEPKNLDAKLALSLAYIRNDEFEKAESLIIQLRQTDPNRLPFAVALAELRLRQGRNSEAIQICDQLVQKHNSATAYLVRARTKAAMQMNDSAEKDYIKALQLDPNDIETKMLAAEFYFNTQNQQKALQTIEQALQISPEDVPLLKQAAYMMAASGSPEALERAQQIVDRGLTIEPLDPDFNLLKANFYIAQRNQRSYEQAAKILEPLIERQPGFTRAWTMLARMRLDQNRYSDALDLAYRGLNHSPQSKQLMLVKARVEAARNPSLASATLKELHQLYPADTEIVLYLTDVLIKSQQADQAVKLLNEFSDNNPQIEDTQKKQIKLALARALANTANQPQADKLIAELQNSQKGPDVPLLRTKVQIAKDMQNYSRAAEEVKEYISKYPQDSKTPIMVARELSAEQNPEQTQAALDILQSLIDKNPDNLQAMGLAAMLMQLKGDYVESAKLYEKIIAAQPDNVIAINNLAWILCVDQGNCQKALEYAQKGLKIMPSYVDLLDTHGVILHKLGKTAQAVEQFEKALELYPPESGLSANTHLNIAKALLEMGQNASAVSHLRSAISLGQDTGTLSDTDLQQAKRLLAENSAGL